MEGIANRIVAEINDRFTQNIKIYEIQSIVEHELLEANEYAIAKEYINYRTKRDFDRAKATDINFFVGKAINPAHQNPALPINFGIKIRLIQELAEYLEKMGKHIKVSYF